MSGNTTTHTNPLNRSDVIHLRPEAQAAHSLWLDQANVRRDSEYVSRTRPDMIEQVLSGAHGDVLAKLVQAALDDVASNPLGGKNLDRLGENFAAAKMLLDLHDQLDPQGPAIKVEREDHCRHGVAFTDTCTACDAD